MKLLIAKNKEELKRIPREKILKYHMVAYGTPTGFFVTKNRYTGVIGELSQESLEALF